MTAHYKRDALLQLDSTKLRPSNTLAISNKPSPEALAQSNSSSAVSDQGTVMGSVGQDGKGWFNGWWLLIIALFVIYLITK